MSRPYVKAQSTVRTDGRETVTIKLIGWYAGEIDDLLGDMPESVLRVVGLARQQERARIFSRIHDS